MIDIQRGITKSHLHKTMVHEMCHVWAIHFFQDTGHSDILLEKDGCMRISRRSYLWTGYRNGQMATDRSKGMETSAEGVF